jgi:hypothetical protein
MNIHKISSGYHIDENLYNKTKEGMRKYVIKIKVK